MASVATYLNFPGTTGEAFAFYKDVFGTEYVGHVLRYRDVPQDPSRPIAAADLDLVMNVTLPITGGHLMMETDAPESMGFSLVAGNNVHIVLNPDTREEGDRLYAALSAGGQAHMPMAEMFWGAYWGSLVDRFGMQWMINVAPAP
jgi:PhnB protein